MESTAEKLASVPNAANGQPTGFVTIGSTGSSTRVRGQDQGVKSLAVHDNGEALGTPRRDATHEVSTRVGRSRRLVTAVSGILA